MNFFSILTQYIPLALSVAQAVEQHVTAPGATKKQIAMNLIQDGAEAMGQAIPEAHVQIVSGLVDSTVKALNQAGVFKSSGTPAAAPSLSLNKPGVTVPTK